MAAKNKSSKQRGFEDLFFVYRDITLPYRLNRERLRSCGCKASSCCHVLGQGTYVGRTQLAC